MLETLVINGVLAALLLATLVYAIKLNRRMGDLRRGRAELDQAVQRFAAASADADRTMARLTDLANGQGRMLQESLKKAAALADDLKFLIERADTAADRLEAAITQSRRPQAPAAIPTAATAPAAKAPTTTLSKAELDSLPEDERRLLTALAGLR
jgi:hypothetical protein